MAALTEYSLPSINLSSIMSSSETGTITNEAGGCHLEHIPRGTHDAKECHHSTGADHTAAEAPEVVFPHIFVWGFCF